MITTEQVETILERVRPYLQADGGDIQLIRLDGNSADVRLTGRCAGCETHCIIFPTGTSMTISNGSIDTHPFRPRNSASKVNHGG